MFNRQFEVVPIPGREVVQRNFANLLKNGHEVGKKKYSSGKITLNDRFTLMYHGFKLREVEPEAPSSSDSDSETEHDTSLESKSSGIEIIDLQEVEEREPMPSIGKHFVRVFIDDGKEQTEEGEEKVEEKTSENSSSEAAPKKRKRVRRGKNTRANKAAAKKADNNGKNVVDDAAKAVERLSLEGGQ